MTLSPSGERVAERSGAGRGDQQEFAKHGENAVEMVHHVFVDEADDAVTTRFEEAGPPFVILALIVMRIAIHLDDEHLRRSAGEVGDVAANDGLAAELEGLEAAGAEGVPEAQLSGRGIGAHPFGAFDQQRVTHAGLPLSRPLRGHPLP
jgi:hypothetical protein